MALIALQVQLSGQLPSLAPSPTPSLKRRLTLSWQKLSKNSPFDIDRQSQSLGFAPIALLVLLLLVAGLGLAVSRVTNLQNVFQKPKAAEIQSLLADDFENGLGNWQVQGNGVDTAVDTDSGSNHGKLLRVSYSGDNSHIKISKDISALTMGKSNLVYEIEFYDDPQRGYGAGFYIADASKKYIEFVVNSGVSNYILRNGSTSFDTKIPRSMGWHKIQIFVTTVGSYLAIDGQSLVYLRAQIPYPNENSESFPINNDIRNVKEVGIEYPSWGKPASLGYWDNFRVYEFRPQNKTTSQKEEDLILEYLSSYEANLSNSDFLNAQNQLKGTQNFQLSQLALAGAYGVRYKTSGNSNDLNKFKEYLSSVVNNYWGGWKSQDYEAPISGQALTVLASWRWSNLDNDLQENIKKVLDDIGTVTNQRCISQTVNGYNSDNTINDSKGEEFAWMSSYLKFVADVYHDISTTACGNNDPNTTKWSFRAANFACAATTHADRNNSKRVDSSDICQNINPPSPALTSNFIMRNHSMDHPGYALTIAWGMAQAQLYQLNQGKTGNQIDLDYRRNITVFYSNNIASLIRFSNYTYKALGPSVEDRILAYTGKDDWDQDATLQDQAWAYFDKIFASRSAMNWTNKLDAVVNYSWLTRSGKTIYPSVVDNSLSQWVTSGSTPCGSSICPAYNMNSSLYFFLNSMDAIDRFETLFIINPTEYKLSLLSVPTPASGNSVVGTGTVYSGER